MHTKGPWEISDESGLVDGCACIEAVSGVVAHVELWEHEDEETMQTAIDNARLISAAPDLYAACNMLIRGADDGDKIQRAIDLAIIAIDKAEGR